MREQHRSTKPAHLDDCEWRARGVPPCEVCDACTYDAATVLIDHPATLPLEKLSWL